MTDIYINRGGGNRWKWLAGLVLVLLVLTGIRVLRTKDEGQGPENTPVEESTTNTSEPPAGDPSMSEASVPESGAAPDLGSIDALIKEGNWPRARAGAFTALEQANGVRARRQVESRLSEIHTAMIQNSAPMEEKVAHVVKSGDTLGKLAAEYGTTIESIKARNGLDSSTIVVGQRLQILTGDFQVDVNKSLNEMVVRLNGRFFKRYRVGTGTDSSTPEGDFEITVRAERPVWYHEGRQIPYGDPENLLGTHYLKLDIPGIGLHGTWEPETVGTQSSAGCVRLVNDEIRELYNLLTVGTPVTIQN